MVGTCSFSVQSLNNVVIGEAANRPTLEVYLGRLVDDDFPSRAIKAEVDDLVPIRLAHAILVMPQGDIARTTHRPLPVQERQYVNCTASPGTTGRATGSCTFQMRQRGTFEFRFFPNNGLTPLVTSNSVIVP
ncbi:MAG: hypothetical protein FJ147_21045 [Deltaproteobacteria bacterium]|nr:hypothetical protein [Deltaproteobacteria bacterium]